MPQNMVSSNIHHTIMLYANPSEIFDIVGDASKHGEFKYSPYNHVICKPRNIFMRFSQYLIDMILTFFCLLGIKKKDPVGPLIF